MRPTTARRVGRTPQDGGRSSCEDLGTVPLEGFAALS